MKGYDGYSFVAMFYVWAAGFLSGLFFLSIGEIVENLAISNFNEETMRRQHEQIIQALSNKGSVEKANRSTLDNFLNN